MKIKYKTFAVKADEANAGVISGFFSTYDRIPDSYGDVVAPGAFTETIQKRRESGHPFPLVWDHNMADPELLIGQVDEIEDQEKGPWMTAHFFDTAKAQAARDLVKAGCVYQFSFAYWVLEQAEVTLEDGTKANELRKLDLFEVSIVPIPANQNAVMTDIKSGRRNSKADADKLEQAINLIRDVLGQLDDQEDPDGEDEPDGNAAAEDQKASNPEREKLLAYLKTIDDKED